MSFYLSIGDRSHSQLYDGEPPPKIRNTRSSLNVASRTLQSRYLSDLCHNEDGLVPTYTELALVKDEEVKEADFQELEELTKFTLQGDIDRILRKKEPLGDLKDIFHYKGEPCPKLILIVGCPG